MAFDQLLKKNFWIVVLPLIAIAAALNAQAVTQLVGVGLMPDDKALSAPPAISKAPPASTGLGKSTSAEPILARNAFDHVTGPLRPPSAVEGVESPTSAAMDLSDPLSAPPCDGVKVLVIAASSDPDWSFAAFGADNNKSILRRRGGEVSGKKVQFVGWDRVWMQSSGSLCQASLFKSENPTPKPAAPAAPAPGDAIAARGGATSLDPALAKGIQKISATEYNIDRGVVDKILENQSELMRQARVVPEQEGGKVVGIRLFGIRPDTLLGALGMENGDRLQTINGFDMASPEKALEAYARLRTADKLTVQVNRRGQNMNLDYNIR
ncbi:MAG: general secretion pathway protein GspC [Polyangiaceae bacterium]|nr:general secretion pathway protein GspC [Polyangiaceae bacterium]